MTAYIQSLTALIAQNPNLAGLLVFLIAASESIAIVGAIIPGTAILIGIGAIVGLGHLGLWPILIWATLGAIAGDGFSYWLGGRYRGRLHEVWPFSRNPDVLKKGEQFFGRHGGKSVAIGRFVPVLRSVVPLIAGGLGMTPIRFYAVNVASAMAWAPAHILPGALVGASLGFLDHISSRLAIAVLLLLVGAVAMGWLARFLLLRLLPLLDDLRQRTTQWLDRRPPTPAGTVIRKILSPTADVRSLLPMGILLAFSVFTFVALVEEVADRSSLALSDHAISQLVQNLRTSWGDHLMVAITSLGDAVTVSAIAIAVLGWLLWRRAWALAAGMALTLLFATGFSSLLKGWMGIARPTALYEGAQVFSFPSGHATMSAALFGIIGWVTAKTLHSPGREWTLLGLGGLVGMIAVSRIYLAAHWPSDVAGGLLFGFGISAAFGLVFRRTDLESVQPARLLLVAVSVFLTMGTWHAVATHARGLQFYAASPPSAPSISRAAWASGGWSTLPLYRTDLAGEQEEPFIMQWAESINVLRQRLAERGWRSSVALDISSASSFLSGDLSPVDLPVLPSFHEGRAPVLSLVQAVPSSQARLVLRAWSSGIEIEGRGPIYLASIVSEQIVHPAAFASVPVRRERNVAAMPPQLSSRTKEVSAPTGEKVILAPL